MKDHFRESSLLPQLFKLLQEHPVLTGPPVGQRHHQVVVLILVPEHLFQFVLRLLPFQQNVGQSLGQPHLADAGIGLGLLQDNTGAGVGKQGWEHIVDIPMPQHFNGPLGGSRQLLVDVDIGVVSGDVLVGDVDIAPGQSHNLTHAHGTGKGQIHRHIEFPVRTLIQGGADHIGGPDVPLFMFHFRQDHIVEGILRDQLPPNRLLEGAAEELDDLVNGGVGHELRFGMVVLGVHRRSFLQGLDVLVHHSGRDVLHFHIPDDGVDVVSDQGVLAVIHGNAPPLFAVEGDEVQQELRDTLIAGREKRPGGFLILHFRLAFQCVLIAGAGLPLLLGLAVLVHIGVDDGIVFLSFDNGCHNEPSFLVSQVK